MIRVARETLNKCIYDNEKKLTPKVVLVTHFHAVVDFLSENLKDFNPLKIIDFSGNIGQFNDPNDNNRLIIINDRYCVGFDLYDTTGLFPRFIYMMSRYAINAYHYVITRIYGGIGRTTVRFFHGISQSDEKSILRTKYPAANYSSPIGLTYPYDYENEYENLDFTLANLCFDVIIENNITMTNMPSDLVGKYNEKRKFNDMQFSNS